MTTFVVSLFLPYTIDFNVNTPIPATPRAPSPPPLKRSNSSFADFKQQLSLLNLHKVTPPQTPGLYTEQDPFFPPQDTSTHVHPISHDPRSTLRTDFLVPDWGRGRVFNQPRSKVGAAPPSTVLQYSKQQALVGNVNTVLDKVSGTFTPREASQDKKFSNTTWTVKPAVHGNGGLTNAVNAAEDAGVVESKLWVGTVGFPTDSIGQGTLDDIESKLESEYDALTVYVNDNDFDGHYSHYCKTILWPVFHYQIPDHPKSKAYEDHSWCYYVKINEAFAERIIRDYKHGDTIWIHDYHLLLLPAMLRKRLPDARIGFSLHTAFPSSEVFRCLAMRKILLEGMCGANIVVFHTEEYVHHFLQTCSRLMVVECTSEGVQMEDRFVNVANVPIGIVPRQLQALRKEPEVDEWVKVLREKYRGKRLIVARDKLDGVRGVRQKMLSYELFLNKNPEWRGKVVLIQVATSTSADNKELDNTVSDIVTRVNAQHSTLSHQALVFLFQDIAHPQYLALLTVADVLMVTSLRDGMNLTCHEYLLCQDGKSGQPCHGSLILSEFTGSASIFKGNELSVNPWDYQQCARRIKQALEMPQAEKDERYSKLIDIVHRNDGSHWIQALASRLESAYTENQNRDTMSVPRLALAPLCGQYKSTTSRLFILDYEGTLANMVAPSNAPALTTPQRVTEVLVDLIDASPNNIVYITSARKPAELDAIFSQIPGIGLIAENGSFIRPVSCSNDSSNEWLDLADAMKCSKWKEIVRPFLQYYHERIEGSWIEERHCSLILHYEHVAKKEEVEAAAALVGECVNHINDSCRGHRVRAVPTDRSVLVESVDFNKQTAAAWVFSNVCGHASAVGESERQFVLGDGEDLTRCRTYSSSVDDFEHMAGQTNDGCIAPPDFLMVAGDDRQDEGVFRWANSLGKKKRVKEVVSVCVSKRNTEARFTLSQGVNGLLNALQKLARL